MNEENWTEYGADVKECVHLPSMGGWFGFHNEEPGPAVSGDKVSHRWEDYIKEFEQESIRCAESIRNLILARWPNDLPLGGFWHQGQTGCDKTVPIAACGGKAEFSMRAWGDLVAAVISSRDDKDHSYVEFAWYSLVEK